MGEVSTAKKILLALIALAFITILSLTLSYFKSRDGPVKNYIDQKLEILKIQEDEGEQLPPGELPHGFPSSSGGGSGGSGGGGGGGGGSGSSPESDSCIEVPVYHSITEVNTQQICNSYQGSDCIDKSVLCHASINNRDYSMGGIFKSKLTISSTSGIVHEELKDFTLGPQESALFDYTQEIQGIQANEEIKCLYSLIEVPTYCPN